MRVVITQDMINCGVDCSSGQCPVALGITAITGKRVAGKGTDSWSGKRVWNTKELRPKLVFCKRV